MHKGLSWRGIYIQTGVIFTINNMKFKVISYIFIIDKIFEYKRLTGRNLSNFRKKIRVFVYTDGSQR